ncbi:MAG: Arc family DNA-binding protein [Planctomycetota bacterium]|nr:Arc family DNA-binding protein [Planctomycetota bacterium]
MSKQRKNYPLRLPEELFADIKRWANQEMRSVNGQIEFLLRQAVERRKKSDSREGTCTEGEDS